MRTRTTIFAALLISVLGCDRAPKPAADEPKPPVAPTAKTPAGDDSDEDHAHDEHDDVHLGAHMYELSRRFAAVWFAGRAGNVAMVDYQLHEMHEVIEELEEARPKEAGVDVVARLERDIESQFETLEQAVEAGDQKKFEVTYQTMIGSCTACHAETKHPYIVVKVPDHNPYSNLQF